MIIVFIEALVNTSPILPPSKVEGSDNWFPIHKLRKKKNNAQKF
jgi:hypothetical protein